MSTNTRQTQDRLPRLTLRMSRYRQIVALAAAALWGALDVPVQAAPQEAPVATAPVRTAEVTRITATITIDGVARRTDLELGAEDRRPDSATARYRRGADGSAPTSRCCTTTTISTSASSPTTPSRGGAIGTQMARDASLGSDDRIEILLDTFRDQRSAFYFATNPAGALVDGLAFANGQLNTEWDAIWDVRTRRTARGLDRGVRDSVQEPELSGRRKTSGVSTSRATSIGSSKTTAGPAPGCRRSSCRCPKPARSRTSAG